MAAPKKIAILADFPLHCLPESQFPAPTGHYATWLPQLARGFEKAEEFELHWVTLDPLTPQPTCLKAWSQSFHVLPTWKRGRATTLFWADRRAIQRKLQEIQPDLVHGWGNENIWGWATVSSQRPHILSVQGLLGVYGELGRQHLRERLMVWIERFVLQKAQIITTESPWARERIQEKTGRNDIRLVEYGVADPFFEADYRPDPNHPFALMVGTADYRKGIDVAVKLFCRPAQQNFRLKVVGGVSPYGENWKKGSPANVEWLGRKTQREIIDLLVRARCLILPTRADVCANVVKEARVLGLPIVASPHGGHTQYIIEGKNGFIRSLSSGEDWEIAISEFFHDPTKAVSMGRFLRAEHRRILRPQETANHFLGIYEEMLKTRKRTYPGRHNLK